ncbi:MAG: PAS domain S-box protein, partial [Armatimonadetes bacterium]|nr:PAS domain S-box protein [Armatimonadota bacterium]
KTPDFRKTNWRQCSDIIVDGKHAGDIEVYYLVEKPNLDEGPFLKEERLVLDTIAERLRGITQLKKADEALKDSEIRFHGLFENSSEFLFTLDLKGNFTDINKAAEIITGYTKSELLKMNFKDYTSKRDHRKLLITFSNIYKTGKPLHDLPIEAIMKDGSVKYFETSFSLLKKGEQIIGFQGSSKDVTARKQAEEELRISNENTKIIIEKAPVGVVVIGKDRKIKMINDTALKMAGVDTPDDILGKNCSEYLCPAQKLDCPILDRDQKVDNSERIFRRKDGKEIPIIKTVTEISLDGEDVLLETFVDITERKQAEETLKKRMNELEIFNDAAVDRELKMLELKKEINELLEKSGQKPKYEIPV